MKKEKTSVPPSPMRSRFPSEPMTKLLQFCQNQSPNEGNTTKEIYQAALARFFREQLLRERSRLQITQVQMAELLMISLRSCSYIECGNISCGALTLSLFLIYCCEDRMRFLDELEAVFRKAEEDAYASL